MAFPSLASILRRYWLPLVLYLASRVFLQITIPSYILGSHYYVLGIRNRYCSIDEVTDAYETLSAKWRSGVEVPSSSHFIEIRYRFELLTNPLWKRNYDLFDINEQLDVVDNLKKKYASKNYWEIKIPLLEVTSFDFGDHAFKLITPENFQDMFEHNKPLLIQLYSLGSRSSAEFSDNWKRIATLLDGVANIGMVELGEVQLAKYLAQKRLTGEPFFSNGIPSIVAFPLDCRSSHCLVRYNGELSVDAIVDWFATNILYLPRILYYSKESLGRNFLAKSSPCKVKVIFFSRTGERATPFVRQAVKNYWTYASFAFVLWRDEESLVWWNAFEVESAPAIVILKDPGVKPFVHHGSVNGSWLLNILEKNKQQELPQLRSATSMELGCDPRGYSRSGGDTVTWYCVILAGRQSPELDKMRKTMRRVQEILTYGDELKAVDKDQPWEPSAIALKQKRLTFAWLDGEMQKDYCNFYLDVPYSNDACGPRRYPIDEPQLFIVRYKRNGSEDLSKVERKRQVIADLFQKDVDPVSQLVARYNGTEEIQGIIQWISKIIKDGDNRNLPFYRTSTPRLIPEDTEPLWSRGAQRFISTSKEMKQRVLGTIGRNALILAEILNLAALISFTRISLRSNVTVPVRSNQSSKPTEEGDRPRRRSRSLEPRPVSRSPSFHGRHRPYKRKPYAPL